MEPGVSVDLTGQSPAHKHHPADPGGHPAPATKRPADEDPADENPIDENPSDEYPADEYPIDEEPAGERFADKYLEETSWRNWDIVDYMEKNALVGFELLRKSWRVALTNVQASGTPDEIKKATSLLKKFHSSDGRRARQWRDRDKPPSGGVIIKNSFNHSTIHFPSSSAQQPPPRRSKGKGRTSTDPRGDVQGPKNKDVSSSGVNALFTKTYRDMSDDRKWRLPSGNYVEDVLHSKFSDHQGELPVHSWIVDTCDLDVQKCFDEEEDWKAICDKVPQLSQPDKLLVDSMKRFMPAKSSNDLWNFVHKTTFLKHNELRSETNRGPEWVDFVIRSLLPIYESGSFHDKNNLENWYTVNIWYPIFDRCMLTIQGAHVSRGESKSVSVSNRKNPHPRDPAKRRRVGRLYDGLLRIDGEEAGVIEHARVFNSDTSPKWCLDSLKVAKALRDMLRQQSSKSLREVSVIGLVTAGLEFQLMRMNYGEGNICLLSQEPRQRAPSNMADFQSIFQLFVTFWRFRTLMLDFKNAVAGKSDTPEELARKLMETPSAVSKTCSLLPSIETDGEVGETDRE